MTEKRLTVILYGCDRNLWRGGPLSIRVADVLAAGGPQVLYKGTAEESTLELRLSLPFDTGQVYGLTFAAPRHRPAWQMIRHQDFIRLPENIEQDDMVLRLMLVPDSPGTTDLAGGFDRLKQAASPFVAPQSGVDEATFQKLDVAAQMAFLNIEAKLRETIVDGVPLLSLVRGVRQVAVDRVFMFFDAWLKGRMTRAADFAGAAGHPAVKGTDLPGHPDSWKHTKFAEGNVQLSFSRDAAPLNGSSSMVHSADVDIDLGRGMAHAQEWLVNNVFKPGHKTNQALVYGLLYAQGILPRYALDPADNTTARAIPRLQRVEPAPQRARGRRTAPVRRAKKRATRKRAAKKR